MSTLALAMASPNSLKRTYAEAGLEDALSARAPSSPFSLLTAPSPMAITQYHAASQASPPTSANPAHLPMPNGSPTVMPSGPVPTDGASASPTKQPAKKAKLAFTEKEARRVEKEFKDREREEEKARKEAEKARKDGEKAKKEGERGKKEAEKEAEKAKREEEKKLKDAEKEEKRRAKEETARLKQEDKARREAEKEEDKIKKESVSG